MTNKQASTVIKLFNDWFDLLYIQLPKNKFTLAYGLDIKNKNKVLYEISTLVENMRIDHKCKPTSSLKPFQKGKY